MAIRSDANRALMRWAAAGVMLVGALAARAAQAEGPSKDEGFIQPSPTVQHRMYTLDGKNEIAVFGDFSLNNILTQHEGATLAYEHNFGEYFGIEVLGGGGFGGVTSLVNVLRTGGDPTATFNHSPVNDLANSGALVAWAQAGVRLSPFYGKFNLASELPVHFDLYLTLGAGMAYVNYTGILDCATDVTGTPAACTGNQFYTHSAPTWAFSGGGGMRIFITQLITIRAEVRDIVFPDRYYTGLDLRHSVETRTTLSTSPGLTQVPLMFIGLGFLL